LVDLVILQSLSYTAGALSVVLGVIYYAINLKETIRNRRVTLANNLLSTVNSEDAQRKYFELMSMQWTDFEDFKSKYDSSVNPENYIKRYSFWQVCDHVGWQYRKGLVDLETIYFSAGLNIFLMWRKFKPLIEALRKWQYGHQYCVNWEYLAEALDKMSERLDPEMHKNWDAAVKSSFQHEDTRTI
jgi:hypothetical protein